MKPPHFACVLQGPNQGSKCPSAQLIMRYLPNTTITIPKPTYPLSWYFRLLGKDPCRLSSWVTSSWVTSTGSHQLESKQIPGGPQWRHLSFRGVALICSICNQHTERERERERERHTHTHIVLPLSLCFPLARCPARELRTGDLQPPVRNQQYSFLRCQARLQKHAFLIPDLTLRTR